MTNKSSGFEMKETLEWYQTSGIRLAFHPTYRTLPVSIESQGLIGLNSQELGVLYYLFPDKARERSILRKIVGQPTNWFHQNSTPELPLPTTDVAKALSPTALIPSYIDYTPWKELKVPTADIWLYQLPANIPPEVRKIILSEGFIHEVGHSIVQPAMYISDYKLKFPDGKQMDGLEAMLHFAELAEQHPPISHYAATYRGKENKFEGNPNEIKTAISEELCESIAAYFLGFAYCGENYRSKNPFADRPEIKTFVCDFLAAERIKE